MAAYVIAHATIKDPEKLKEYGAVAGPSIKAAGGELISAAHVTDVLAGSHDHQRAVVIRFADAQAARDWYASDAYQSAIPTRERAMDAVFIIAEDPQA
ncbi:MAG: DUF1330 domain-containing protein [Minwuiales bacterium]|nr:DUF1330 domain-containing protein [Minwuiales bacterium]